MKSFLFDRFPAPRGFPAPPRERLGEELKTMFDNLTTGPMPDRLVQLADALEEAFQKGELFQSRPKLDA